MIELFKLKIKKIFMTCPKTQQVLDLQDEMLDTLMEKYDELMKSGYDQKTAYKVSLKSIKDFNDVIRELKKQGFIQNKAKIISEVIFSTAAYFMAIILTYLVYSFITHNWKWSWGIIVAGAFIYVIGIMTILFRFTRARNKFFLSSVCLFIATMMTTTGVYLLLSFIFMVAGHSIWCFSWILFLIGLMTYDITNLLYLWHNKKRLTKKIDLFIIMILMTLTIYFSVSFSTGKWSVSWLIFVFVLFLALFAVSIDQLGIIKDSNKKITENNKIVSEKKNENNSVNSSDNKTETEFKKEIKTEVPVLKQDEKPQSEKTEEKKSESLGNNNENSHYLDDIIESQAKKDAKDKE